MDQQYVIFQKVYCPLIAIPSIFGTFLVLIALWNRKISVAPKTSALLISVLLVNNLLVLLVLGPLMYLRELWGVRMFSKKPTCMLFIHMTVFLPYIQMSCHVLLSLERCVVVTCPLKAKVWITYRRVTILTCLTIIFVGAVSSTAYLRARVQRTGNITFCFTGEFKQRPIAIISVYLNLIFWQILPLGLMTIANLMIVITLYHRYRRSRVLSGRVGPSQKHTRLTITLVIMTVVFCIFTIPTTAHGIMTGRFTAKYHQPPLWLFRLRWLTFRISFVADWIILLAMSTRIRRSVWYLLTCKAARCSADSEPYSASQSNGPQIQRTVHTAQHSPTPRKSLVCELRMRSF